MEHLMEEEGVKCFVVMAADAPLGRRIGRAVNVLAPEGAESDKHLFPESCLQDDWTDDYATSEAFEAQYRAVTDPDDGQKWPKGLTEEDGKLYRNGKLLVQESRVPTLMENMTQTNTLCHPSPKEILTQTEAVRQPCLTENTSRNDMIHERPCHTTVVFYDHQFTSVAGWRAHAQPSTFTEQSAKTSSADNETPRAWRKKPCQPNLWSILRDEVPDDRPYLVTQDNDCEEQGQCQTKQQIKSKSDSEVLNPRRSTQRQLHEHHDSNTQELLYSNCVQCSRPWSMTTTNATWYIEHEMQVPKRCIQCRATRRNRTNKKMQRRALIPSQEVKITEHPHSPSHPWNKPVFPEPSHPSRHGDKPVEEEWPKLQGKFWDNSSDEAKSKDENESLEEQPATSSMPYWSLTSVFNYDSPAQQELLFNTKDLNPDKRGFSEDDSVSDLFDCAPSHISDQQQEPLLSCKDSAYQQSLSEAL